MNYYHCLNCYNIPTIEKINDDKVLIQCKQHGKKEIIINDFINNYIEICNFKNCNNIPKYLIDEQHLLCENCLYKYHYNSKQLLENIYCHKHNNLLIDYCLDCEESKCENCKKEDLKNNHNYLNDNIKDEKKKLENFINNAEIIIKEIKDKFEKMEKELNLYKCILFNKNSVIITNIQIQDIIKDIQNKEKIFLEKMKKIKTEFENLSNFDYINNNKDYKNDETIHNINNFNLNKSNNDKINGNLIINNNNNANSNKNNNENKKSINVNNIPNNNINIKAFGNNRENEIKDNYIQMFQKPKNKLYQDFSIKLTDISNKNQYIIQKIEEISNKIEDKINPDERNKYLISIAHIAREADNYSKELCEILIQRFYKEYKEFSSISYNKAKTELSSWVNQSLIKDESNDDIKDLRCFYNYYCEKENIRIQKYLNLDSNNSNYNSILKDFTFQKLFRFLSQLYTEVLLFSDKNIYLKYTEKCDFIQNIMKDITDLNGKRFVMFSVLPGLFVNESNIKDGKILVFCNKNKNLETNILFKNLNKYVLNLKNTIIKIDINYIVNNNKYHIKIKCLPQIPDIENLKFNLKIVGSSKIFSIDKQKAEFFLEKINKNKSIYVTIERNGEIIKSNEIKLK